MRSHALIASLLLAALLVACQPATPPPDMDTALTQAVASLTQTAAVPAPVTGITFDSGGVRFVIPEGLAGGATIATIPAEINPDLPFFATHPDYREITLVNYALSDRFHDPVIRIYPAPRYAEINEVAAREIGDLRSAITDPGAIADLRNMPFLPIFNAGQTFHAQTRLMDFASGDGLRYLTLFSQAYPVINNNELVYTFQGLTADGQYYVAVLLPVSAPFLPEQGNPAGPVPANGFPFPDWNAPNFPDLFNTYIINITEAMNDLPDSGFTPTLEMLDALVASIEVYGP